MYIVYGLINIDKFKGKPLVELYKIYKDEEKAYEYALRKQLSYINLLDLALDIENNGKELFMFITNSEKRFKERLQYFYENINKIFGNPKIPGLPSCIIVFVEQKNNFDDDHFDRDISNLKEMYDDEII